MSWPRCRTPAAVTQSQVEKQPDGSPNIVRCPDPARAAEMVALIERLREARDSIGGVAEIVAVGVPAGLGEPVFDKLKADLAKALFSLPAVLGVEYGVGFGCATLRGSENNDLFRPAESGAPAGSRIVTGTNRHGGMLGGISSGMPIVLRTAVKPTSSLPRDQATVTTGGEPTTIRTKGRHDPCLLPRFVPMAEAMVAIVLADHWLRLAGDEGAGRRLMRVDLSAAAARRVGCAARGRPGTAWALRGRLARFGGRNVSKCSVGGGVRCRACERGSYGPTVGVCRAERPGGPAGRADREAARRRFRRRRWEQSLPWRQA